MLAISQIFALSRKNAMKEYTPPPICKYLAFLLFTIAPAFALSHLAVLEIVPSESVKKTVSIDEVRFLSDKLRSSAVLVLPKDNYAVLSRENLIQLIPPDEKEAECLLESCVVEIGRAIGADYISQGTIGKFGSQLTISVELYATMSGKLLASFTEESKDINGLLAVIKERTESFFSAVIEDAESQSAVSSLSKKKTVEDTGNLSDSYKEKDSNGGENFSTGRRWGTWALNTILPGVGSWTLMGDVKGGLVLLGFDIVSLIVFLNAEKSNEYYRDDDSYTVKKVLDGTMLTICVTSLVAGAIWNIYRSASYDKAKEVAGIDRSGFNFAILPRNSGVSAGLFYRKFF